MRRLGAALALLLVALPASAAGGESAGPHYVAKWLPEGLRFRDANHPSNIHYRGRGEHVAVITGCCSSSEYAKGRTISIRGHSGLTGRLNISEYGYENPYGRYITWEERRGVSVTVESRSQRGLPLPLLRRVAERVRTVRPSYFHRLVLGTQPDPFINSQIPKSRKERFVKRGRANGHHWVLSALVPPRFPLGWYDLRNPCDVLTYRGKRTLGLDFGCGGIPNWQLIRGQVFVWGIAPRGVHRVRVKPIGGDDPDRVFKTIRRPWLGHSSLYVAAMPRETCQVEVVAADGSPDIGPTGPVNDKSEDRRCSRLQR